MLFDPEVCTGTAEGDNAAVPLNVAGGSRIVIWSGTGVVTPPETIFTVAVRTSPTLAFCRTSFRKVTVTDVPKLYAMPLGTLSWTQPAGAAGLKPLPDTAAVNATGVLLEETVIVALG